MAKPVILATGERFSSLRALRQRLHAVRDANRGGELVGGDRELLLAVLARHPDAGRLLPGIVRIVVARTEPRWGTGRSPQWCFVAVTADGTRRPVSLDQCLRPLQDAEERVRRSRREAYRQAVAEQLKAVRLDGRPLYCPLCERWRTDIEAHHVGETFTTLVARFEAEVGESALPHYFDGLFGGGVVFRATDAAFARRWQAYHREHARLVPLCRRCHEAQTARERTARG